MLLIFVNLILTDTLKQRENKDRKTQSVEIIAHLLIERKQEKIHFKEKYRK